MKKSLIYLFAASLAVISCKRGLEPEQPSSPFDLTVSQLGYEDQSVDEERRVERSESQCLDFSWGVESLPVSRVTDAKFQSGDDIGVYIHPVKPMAAATIHSANMRYATSDAGVTWRAGNAMSGALTAAAYFSTAYYPYQSTIASITAVPHTVLANQSAPQGAAAGNMEKSDFMSINDAVVGNLTTAPSASLAFVHRMSKFRINASIPATIESVEVTGVKSVVIKGLKPSGTINLTTGTVAAATGTAVDITPRLLSGTGAAGAISSYEAVVYPQTVAAGTLLVEFVCTMKGGTEKPLTYTVPAGTTLAFATGKRMTLTLSSSADVAFMSELDLMDGKAKTGVALKIKVPSGKAWTLTSPATWVKLSLTSAGVYGASITGTGTGAEQTVYVSVEGNDTQATGWTPRELSLTLAAATVPVSLSAKYLVVQGYHRHEVTGSFNAITLISDTPLALPKITSNQVWKIKIKDPKTGKVPTWLKITKGSVKWAAATAANTITIPEDGYDYVGSALDLHVVADPNTLTRVSGTLANGTTAASVSLTYGTEEIDVHWTHSYRNAIVPGRTRIWAAGNLVATNTTAANTAGQGGARIGGMYDGGLYFRFGSLVGTKGGATGSGVGTAVASHGLEYWLRPTGHTASTTWGTSAYFTGAQTTGDFKTFHPTDNAGNDGIGDACRYYLGDPWRLPTGQEFGDLCNNTSGVPNPNSNLGWVATGGKETNSTTTPATTLYGGWWSGNASTTPAFTSAMYFVGSGHRTYTDGALYNVGSQGVYWSSSIGGATYGLYLDFSAGYVAPQTNYNRVYGFTLRCVQ